MMEYSELTFILCGIMDKRARLVLSLTLAWGVFDLHWVVDAFNNTFLEFVFLIGWFLPFCLSQKGLFKISQAIYK